LIVVDDQISYDVIIAGIASWYPGAVVSIRDSRPHGQILDPEIPTFLLKLRQPTFVTINYHDFFNRRFLHADYSIVCLRLEQLEAERVPDLLRGILRLPDYRTKARRMGKIISWTESGVTHLAI
jgi:hypothetical protein